MKTVLHHLSLLCATVTVLTTGSVGVTAEARTPLDQSNRPEDLKITQAIRKAVVADDSLSLSAKNVKIITADGKVTLIGPVNSVTEKDKIAAYAKESAGTEAEVVNQMEVKDAQP